MPGLAGEVANLIVALKLDDSGFSGRLNRVAGQLRGMDRGLSQMGKGVGQVGSGLSKLATTAAVAATAGIGAVVTAAATFEDAFAGIVKTVSEAELEAAGITFEDLRQEILAMSREMPIAANELAAIGETAGALGVRAQDIDEFIEVIAKLGVTTELTTEQAATSMGHLITLLGLTGQEIENTADVLVALGNAGASTEGQIIEIAERFAAAGKAAGLSNEEIFALSSTIASAGVNVEAAGTALSLTFSETALNIAKTKDEAKTFADALGLSLTEFRKRWDEDAFGAFQELLGVLQDLDQFEQAALLADIGITGTRQQQAVRGLALVTDDLTKATETANNAQGALHEEAEKRFETTISQVGKLRGHLVSAAIIIGDELLPQINELAGEFTDFLAKPATQRQISAFAKDLSAGMREVVDTIRDVDWDPFLSGLQVAGDALRTAFNTFKSLPGPLQGAIIGAIALNKVSGGAVSLLAKGGLNIAGGGLRALFGRGAPGNPMHVFVTNSGGIGGKGGLPGWVAGMSGLTLSGVIALIAGIATPIVMFDIIPKLFPGKEAPKGSIAHPDTTRVILPGDKFEGGEVEMVVPAGFFQQFTGLMPSFPAHTLVQPIEDNTDALRDTAQAVRDLMMGRGPLMPGFNPRAAAQELQFSAQMERLREVEVMPGLPDTAVQHLANLDSSAASLPDTSVAAGEIAGSTADAAATLRQLLPIAQVQRSDFASKLQASVQAQRDQATHLSQLSRKPTRVDVDANVAVTVNTFVSGTMLQRQRSYSRVASDYHGGATEGAF